MDKEFIEDLARKYANACELRSDHKYDRQSVSKGFVEGFEACIRLIEAKMAEDDKTEALKAIEAVTSDETLPLFKVVNQIAFKSLKAINKLK